MDISRHNKRQKRTVRHNKKFKSNDFVYPSASDESDQNNNAVFENQEMNKEKILPALPSPPKSFIKSTNKVVQSDEKLNFNKNMNKESLFTLLDTPGKS